MKPEQYKDDNFPPARRSACADAALFAEIERVKKMPVSERMLEALALGQELQALFRIDPTTSVHGKSNQANHQ